MSLVSPAPSIPHRSVKPRRVKFAYPSGKRRQHFVNDDVVFSHLVAVLSGMFPEGEEFFIRSVRNYRDQITDPELAAQVKGFIGQELTHGREHRMLNERLQEMGYPTRRVDRHVRQLLRLVERVTGEPMSLAATAALEHFTATIAEILLTDPKALALVGDSGVRPMLLWHALEESEHKAVAFDVYKSTVRSEKLRMRTMNIATVIFLAELVLQTTRSLAGDRAAYRPIRLARSLNELRKAPFFTPDAWSRYRSYNTRGFHPDDWDAHDVIERWTAELFASGPPSA
jgi:predicted metal-dependent hydrolase